MNKKAVLIICIIVVALLTAGVSLYGYSLYQAQEEAKALAAEEAARQAEIEAFYAQPDIALVVTEEDISQLELYTNLHSVDLTGSTCYDAIMDFIQAHPGVSVSYTVDLGGTTVSHDVEALELTVGSYDYDTLVASLRYLPRFTALSLPETELDLDQINTLTDAGLAVDYTVILFGQVLNTEVTSLDLSDMDMSQLEELGAAMRMLPNVETLELMAADGTSRLSMTDVKALMDACPGQTLHYTFDFYGNTLSTTTETVELNKVDIGDEGEALIRQALDIMPNCTYFKLDDCGVSSQVMASIRDDYPDTKVVWRIFFGKYNCLTDTEMLRLTNGLKDEHCAELIYCTDVKYMDLGHNESLTDISYVAYMPKLEICILSGSLVEDLSPFQDHPSIEFLELCYCGRIKDLTPLSNCPNLKYLNISYTGVKDLTPLDNVPLERFVCMQASTSSSQHTRFNQMHPDCSTRYNGKQCYGYGWRYIDNGVTFWDYYANMRVIFMYDDVGYVSGKEYTR